MLESINKRKNKKQSKYLSKSINWVEGLTLSP